MQEIFVCLKLTGFDFLYHVLIAGDEVSMLALTIGTDFRVFHRGISLFAILAEGHRFDRLNLELRFLQVLGFFYRPIPAVNDVLRDDSADLTDLQRYTAEDKLKAIGPYALKRAAKIAIKDLKTKLAKK